MSALITTSHHVVLNVCVLNKNLRHALAKDITLSSTSAQKIQGVKCKKQIIQIMALQNARFVQWKSPAAADGSPQVRRTIKEIVRASFACIDGSQIDTKVSVEIE